MSEFVLSCCSTADLSEDHFRTRNIHYICFHYMLNGVMYKDDLGKSISFDEFYYLLSEGAETHTSQVNAEEFMAYFTPFLEQGKDILHVCLSSGLSGVNNSACIARDELFEKFPERKIIIVDSLGASAGYGLLMDRLADMRDAGASLAECAEWAEMHKLEMHHWYFSTDLSFYVNGGRISKASGFVGSMLKICPLMNMDEAGRLVPREKVRGKTKVIKAIVSKMAEFAKDRLAYSGKCFISHSGCLQDAKEVAELVQSTFPKLKGKVQIFNVGTVIGSHTGPGTVALFFWGDPRTA